MSRKFCANCKAKMKNHPANAGGISVPSKLRLPIRLKVGLEFAFHRLTPVVCAFDVIKTAGEETRGGLH